MPHHVADNAPQLFTKDVVGQIAKRTLRVTRRRTRTYLPFIYVSIYMNRLKLRCILQSRVLFWEEPSVAGDYRGTVAGHFVSDGCNHGAQETQPFDLLPAHRAEVHIDSRGSEALR